MSVIVKGLDMPQTCGDCPFCDYEEANCLATNGRNTLPHRLQRADFCPLVEIIEGVELMHGISTFGEVIE